MSNGHPCADERVAAHLRRPGSCKLSVYFGNVGDVANDLRSELGAVYFVGPSYPSNRRTSSYKYIQAGDRNGQLMIITTYSTTAQKTASI